MTAATTGCFTILDNLGSGEPVMCTSSKQTSTTPAPSPMRTLLHMTRDSDKLHSDSTNQCVPACSAHRRALSSPVCSAMVRAEQLYCSTLSAGTVFTSWHNTSALRCATSSS